MQFDTVKCTNFKVLTFGIDMQRPPSWLDERPSHGKDELQQLVRKLEREALQRHNKVCKQPAWYANTLLHLGGPYITSFTLAVSRRRECGLLQENVVRNDDSIRAIRATYG